MKKVINAGIGGKSFAMDIARSYGISFEQLCKSHEEKFSNPAIDPSRGE